MSLSPIWYVVGLSVIFIVIITVFSLYLWSKLKKEKEYATESLPGIDELNPEDFINVSTYSQDTTALPTIDELDSVNNHYIEDEVLQNSFDSM